jgi:BASS family bile acid:Na+ symporter
MQKFKNYMLPVAMIVGALGRSWMAEAGFLMPWLLFFMLLFSFARIAPREVTFSRLHVLLLSIQLFGSLAIYAALRGWNPVIAEGVFICVLAPTATASAVITGLLGGSVGFMTSYVLASNVMVSVAAPVLFSHIGINGDLPFWESVWTICGEVMPILLLPLAAAWLIRWLWPRAQGWFARMSQVPLYLWAISLTIVTGRTVDFLIEQENPDYWVELSIAGITMIICFLQFYAGRRLGRRYGDRISGGQALMQKNTVLAIWMSQIYLNPVASVGPGAYILWQNILNSWQLWRKGRQEGRDLEKA